MVRILTLALLSCIACVPYTLDADEQVAAGASQDTVIAAATVVDVQPVSKLFRAPATAPEILVEGRELLAGAGLANVHAVDTMDAAAARVVELAR